MNKRYFIRFAYNGTNYHGWQIQPNARSVQQSMQDCLALILRQEVSLIGAGRTDTGVHAKEMFAHFETELDFTPDDLRHKMNSFLDSDVAVYEIFEVGKEDHTRFSAISRKYEYLLTTRKNPFLDKWAYEIRRPLDFEKMNEACKLLLGRKDFTSFSRSGTQTKTNICDVKEAYWTKREDYWLFTIVADRFLRNMVRAIVGTLLNIGSGEWNPEYLEKLIDEKDRTKAGMSAPAHGLYLTEVKYPKQIEDLFVR